ncbi:MAG: serine hydrolase [Bacteroidales bacterium]|nr:serine hydrolase [Bacteroidales bacterium]
MKNIVKFVLPLLLVIAIPIILFMQKEENDLQKIDRISEKVFKEFHPTGLSVLVVKDNKIIYEESFGYKNSNTVDFLNNNDIFNIASCTKAFTAAAIGKLVDDGLVNWNDKVIDYIPEFKLSDKYITQNVEIRDILSHRTGLGTFYGDLLWYNTDYSNKDVINRMQYLPIIYDFRTNLGYQNNMYMIAGEIIERVSGKSWESFIQQKFFTPLEMKSSRTSNYQFDGTEEIAFPHYNDSTINYYDFNAGKPAASIWSNVRDLANWTMMLLNDGKWKNEQILSSETVRNLTSAQTIRYVSEEKESFGIHFRNYALGWNTYDYNGRKIIEHNGGMPGYISKVSIIPEENLGIIILNNGFELYGNNAIFYSIIDIITDQFTNDWINYYLSKKLESESDEREFEKERITSKNPDSKPTLALQKYAGKYHDKMYGDALVKFENNKLTLTLLPAKLIFTGVLEHWSENTFKVQFKDPFLPFGLIQFELNESENIIGFKIDLPSGDFHFQNLDFKKIN